MQSDFLPNFILCNTTQRFIRSTKATPLQKPSIPSAKPNFYCGTQVSTIYDLFFFSLYILFFFYNLQSVIIKPIMIGLRCKFSLKVYT